MRRFKRVIVAAFAIVVGIACWLWLTMLSPWFYDPPSTLQPIEDRTHDVFVYGTLRHSLVRLVVIGRMGEPDPAYLEGFRREGLDLKASAGDAVAGQLLQVSARELARLDRYERLGIRYERFRVTLKDGSCAWVYRRLAAEDSSTGSIPVPGLPLVSLGDYSFPGQDAR
ncbi:gamma-glutamylcyclotransferase family protein [Halomonas sp. Bachu 37]|uniref:gamma-glutamylcyclotransferase family protein n=1 Tax=Halomonas kashgarensis TaxID=3084920 RepID=UPI003217277C